MQSMTTNPALDVSELDFEAFLRFFFARPLLAPGQAFTQTFCSEYVFFRAAEPRRLVAHLHAICAGFRSVGQRYALKHLNQGIHAMFSPAGFELQLALWNDAVPLDERLACLQSMRLPYLEFVADHPAPVMENAFDMWWDMVLRSFWSGKGFHHEYQRLDANDKANLDTMLDTLDAILDSDDERCQRYALHGLGHLHHPRVAPRIDQFIEAHAHALAARDLEWVKACRDGTVM